MGLADKYSDIPGGAISLIIHHVIRFIQFIIALSVIGLYAQDISSQRKAQQHVNSDWAFAVVVGSLSAFYALIAFVPIITRAFFNSFVWVADAILWVLYLALFANFGRKYINKSDVSMRMKNAVWIDLVGMLLFFITAVWGSVTFCVGKRRGRTLHTGRAAL